MILRNEAIELEFDDGSGRWSALTDIRTGNRILAHGELLPPILLTVGGRAQASRGINQLFSVVDSETVGLSWKLESVQESKRGVETRFRQGGWVVTLAYSFGGGGARIERRVRIRYEGEGEALLRHFLLRMPFASLGPDTECFIEAPGHAVRPGHKVSSLGFGSWGLMQQGAFCDAPAWKPPFIGIHYPAENRAIAAWCYSESEPFFPVVDRTDRGILLSTRVYLADRFTAGHELEWGAEYLELFHQPWPEALARLQDFYHEAGLRVPDDTPEWARAMDMYEVHVGTLTGTGLAPYPTFAPLIEDLPRIQNLGFDVVYLMPHVPYPSYSVIDYFNMDVQQGSESGFRGFIQRAHELGLKVFIDVTLHGVMDRRARRLLSEKDGASPTSYPIDPTMPEKHPYLSEHPEWFSRNENGDVAMTYTYSFDHASRSWQDFMVSVFRHYVEEYDLDGFRVDSHTWNFFPNWARGLPYPASRSMYGSVSLFKRVREELKKIKRDVVLYSETAGPLLHGTHALGYNYDENWMLFSLFPLASRRGFLCHFLHTLHLTTERMTARDAAKWLDQRRLAMPRGAIKVHHFDSHDTYWRGGQFRSRTFGAASRAIIALLAFIEGGFMQYNGADEGLEEYFLQIMTLRRTQPALKAGDCDYLAVEPSSDMVFAPLRQCRAQTLLPVINCDNASITVRLPIPPSLLEDRSFRVKDLMSDKVIKGPRGENWTREELSGLEVSLGPYGLMLLGFDPVG